MIALVPSPSIDEVLDAVAERCGIDRSFLHHPEIRSPELDAARPEAAWSIRVLCFERPTLGAIARRLGMARPQNVAALIARWQRRSATERSRIVIDLATLVIRRRVDAGRGPSTCLICAASKRSGAKS